MPRKAKPRKPTNAEVMYELSPVMWLASNHPNPHKESLLQMFYMGVYENDICYLDAKNKETGEIVPMLAAVNKRKDGTFDGYLPLAILIGHEEAVKYQAPDGKGGWSGEEANESDEPELGDRGDGSVQEGSE